MFKKKKGIRIKKKEKVKLSLFADVNCLCGTPEISRDVNRITRG